MKQFVKELVQGGSYFSYICLESPGRSNDEPKSGIYVVTQIRNLINVENIAFHIPESETAGWIYCTSERHPGLKERV